MKTLTEKLAFQLLTTPDSTTEQGADEFKELTYLYESKGGFIFRGKDNFKIKIKHSPQAEAFCQGLAFGEVVKMKLNYL